MGVSNYLRSWWEQSKPPAPLGPDPFNDESLDSPFWQRILDTQDGLSAMIEMKSEPGQSHRIMLGGQADGLCQTAPDTSVLVLGPPRSVGKTAGVLVPVVLTARGPAVVVSTKPDLFVATSLHRRRQGRVWQFSPDGSALMPGAEELRWSPISDDWGDCLARASWMVKAADMSSDSRSNNKFWESRAASLLAVTLFYAGITAKSMEWVVEVINDYNLSADFQPMRDEFLERGHAVPAKILNGIVQGNNRTRGDIFASAAVVLSPYLLPGSIATTTDPNFVVEDFVAGQPDERNDLIVEGFGSNDWVDGSTRQLRQAPWSQWNKQRGVYDTIFISCSEENMALTSALVIGFLGDIRRQVLKQHRADELAGLDERRAPVLWAVDELMNVPIPELPTILTDAGSQGLLLCCACQSMSQLIDKWGDAGRGLITLFNNIMVLPGGREKEANELWSLLAGEFDQEVWGGSWSGRGNDREWNASVSYQRRARLEPSDIYSGNPNDADAALVYAGRGWSWIRLQLYFRSHFWPVMLATSAQFACRNPTIRDQGLPYPDLARRNDFSFLNALDPAFAEEFRRQRVAYYARLRQLGEAT